MFENLPVPYYALKVKFDEDLLRETVNAGLPEPPIFEISGSGSSSSSRQIPAPAPSPTPTPTPTPTLSHSHSHCHSHSRHIHSCHSHSHSHHSHSHSQIIVIVIVIIEKKCQNFIETASLNCIKTLKKLQKNYDSAAVFRIRVN